MNSSTSLTLTDLEIAEKYSYRFDEVLSGRDQNLKKIGIFHVCIDQKGEPLISKCSKGGLSYRVSACNLNMFADFRTLLEKNLILLHSDMEMFAFLGFEKYGKINKHSEFCGGKITQRTDSYTHSYNLSNGKNFYQTTINSDSDKIPITNFKLMDYKTSECVKKTLMDKAWWFDKVPNESSKRQYELISHLPSYQIYKAAQPIFTNSTTSTPIPSQNKTPPSIPTKPSINGTSHSKITNTNSYSSTPIKPSTNISSPIINNTPKPANNLTPPPTITNTPTSSFTSLADFQGNNFEKDALSQPSVILQQALMLASKEGYTKFSIKSSFDENEPLQAKPYIHSITGETCHEARVNFYITASNTSGKSIKLILQREFFAFHSIEKDALEAINSACESAKKDAAAT